MSMAGMTAPGMIVAVDGGGSKTDAVAVSLDGRVLAHRRGAATNPQTHGLERAVAVVDSLVTELIESTGSPLLGSGVFLSGLDLEIEIETFRAAVAHLPWASAGASLVDNDMFALLRAGTVASDAVAVVCGTGINCVGVRADGETARFAALGTISGDWGGGSQLGEQALWHAARAIDGRGRPTVFTQLVPAHFALPHVAAVTEALHFGRLAYSALATLPPVVFAAADSGDAVASEIVDRQADEIVALAVAAIDRLHLHETALPVVLGGGVLAAGNNRLLSAIATRLAVRAPLASLLLVRERPIVGAALLALTAVGASSDSEDTARTALADAFATLDGHHATTAERTVYHAPVSTHRLASGRD
jgi:N-acetylglucosamine kinase-like BadF-type ATPase